MENLLTGKVHTPPKLRRSNRPRLKYQLKLQSNRLQIEFFAKNSWNPNQLSLQN